MTKYVIEFIYEVYAETPTAAFREIAERMRPKVEEHMERLAIAAAPDFDRMMPSGCMTGEEHRFPDGITVAARGEGAWVPGWQCVISIREHD